MFQLKRAKSKHSSSSTQLHPLLKTGPRLRTKCLKITQQFPDLASSNYFTTYLPVLLAPLHTIDTLDAKLHPINDRLTGPCVYEQCLAWVVEGVVEEEGLLYMFVRVWVGFCKFEIGKLVEMHAEDKEKKAERVTELFHRQFFYLCHFLYHLVLYIYEKPLLGLKKHQQQELFTIIRNTITESSRWSQVHECIRRNIECKPVQFSQQQIQQNMQQLEQLCAISRIPAPFPESTNALNEFIRKPSISAKIRACTLLVQKVKQQMKQYQILNNINTEHVFSTDDVLASMTYVMWRLLKNAYGACVYVEAVLCCQDPAIDYERLSRELNEFGESSRFCFDTLKCVARVGLLNEDIIFNIV